MRFLMTCLIIFSLNSVASAQEHEKEDALFRVFGWTTYGVVAGDLISTEVGLSQPGVYEANPLQQNRAVRLSAHVALTVVANRTTAKLYRDGHKKAALWTRVAIVAAFGYVTASNLRR